MLQNDFDDNTQVWGSTLNVPGNGGYVPTYDDSQWPDYDETEQVTQGSQEDPSPHCSYCLCSIPECLVKCVKTGKYFCNTSGKSGISHIVYHLVKAHLKEVELPEQNQYSRVPLVCYVCGSTNIFNLGFAQSLAQGSFFVICRDCVNSPDLAPFQLDISKMQNLISEKSLLHWLVRQPTKQESQDFFSKILPEDMNLLEEQWLQNPNASILDLPQIKAKTKVPETRLQYTNIHQYAKVFKDLVKIEENYDEQMTQAAEIKNISVKWTKASGASHIWFADFSYTAETSNTINIGDELILESGNFNHKGLISGINSNEDRVEVKFVNLLEPPPEAKFSIKFVFKRLPYIRMYEALKTFVKRNNDLVSHEIKNFILGKIPKSIPVDESAKTCPNIRINGLPPLNESQVLAINKACVQNFTLIQGPPGTGKTTTIAGLVAHLLNYHHKGPILVCAPSNIAADHVTYSIAKTNTNVVRVPSWNRDGYQSIVEKFNVYNLALELDTPETKRLQQLIKIKATGEINNQIEQEYTSLRTNLETKIIKGADVVVSTCVTSGDGRLKDLSFPIVIIDEATQALEPQILIAAQHRTQKLILVGDHCQLGPVVLCKKAAVAGLETSIVQRLYQLGMRPIRLLNQYRMHPVLAEFPSNFFYEGTLQNGVSVRDRTPERARFPWPVPDSPMFFYSTAGQEELSDSGTSYINRLEAFATSQVIGRLCKAGVNPNQIGVITPYAGQRTYLKQFLPATGDLPPEFYKAMTIASVDSFQGSEHDYIILSCVRSNRSGTIGFLRDPRRLNVAISRAKCGLIIVGSAKCLSHTPLWYHLIKHFQEKQVLVEGQDINHLTPARIVLQMPENSNKTSEIPVPIAETGKNMVPSMRVAEEIDYNDASYF